MTAGTVLIRGIRSLLDRDKSGNAHLSFCYENGKFYACAFYGKRSFFAGAVDPDKALLTVFRKLRDYVTERDHET